MTNNRIYLENTAPIDMLRDLSGKEPLSVDVQLAERLINPMGYRWRCQYALQFVYLRNDGKLQIFYVERIASHWMNKKVETAEAAMEIARQEYDKYTKWKNEGRKTDSPQRKCHAKKKCRTGFIKKRRRNKEKRKRKKINTDFNVEEERRKLLKNWALKEDGVK